MAAAAGARIPFRTANGVAGASIFSRALPSLVREFFLASAPRREVLAGDAQPRAAVPYFQGVLLAFDGRHKAGPLGPGWGGRALALGALLSTGWRRSAVPRACAWGSVGGRSAAGWLWDGRRGGFRTRRRGHWWGWTGREAAPRLASRNRVEPPPSRPRAAAEPPPSRRRAGPEASRARLGLLKGAVRCDVSLTCWFCR